MKKLFLIVPMVILLCFAFACDKEEDDAAEEAMEAQALTDAQAMEIQDTLKKNYTEFFTAMMDMNVDGMLAHYSDTDFQELLMGINIFTSLESFKNTLVEMMEGRESHEWENLEIKVTILSPDTAYVSSAYDYTINYKDGQIYKGKATQTSIWKMEIDAWKITHDHVSWAGEYQEQ
jgi:ketosteroid isomerase-like protein